MMTEIEPKKFPIFGELDSKTMDCKVVDILEPLEYACSKLGLIWHDIGYDKQSLLGIIDLIERRRVYFWVYHEIEMGELSEISLLCFWILKFSPFHNIKKPSVNVNLIFTLYLFTNIVTYISSRKGKVPNVTINVFERIVHAFKYQDLSKESIMVLAESLAG